MRMIKPEDIEFDIFVDEENMIIQATVDVHDAVPVVRCKDCKHSARERLGYSCEMNYRLATNGNFYCADGERKENV